MKEDEIPEQTSNSLVVRDKVDREDRNNIGLQKIIGGGQITALIEYCTPIADSGISPYTDPAQVAAVALWCYDKNVSLIDALAHTFVLNGRVAIDSHMVKGLLQKSGITHKYLRNYSPVYEYSYKDRIFTQEDVDGAKDQFKICFSMDAVKAYLASTDKKPGVMPVLRSAQPIDIEPGIEFSRYYGKHRHTMLSRFTIKEAENAGLLSKDNWSKYPKQCLAARAYVFGARDFADDIIFGMYNPEELGYDGMQTITLDEDIEYLDVQ